MNLKELKSGTDIRGVASDKGGNRVNLTDQAVCMLSCAFAKWLGDFTNKSLSDLKIAVGHDSRITANQIKNNVIQSLTQMGVKVFDCSYASTPAMFMTTIDLSVDGSVQITASHHPFDRNGLKFFTSKSGLDSKDISALIELAENSNFAKSDVPGTVEEIDYMSTYAANLRKIICDGVGKTESQMPLSGYHIVVDASNGVGGFFATEVLEKLGADISGSRYLEPDGMFPNHIPNPEDKKAMQSICDAVLESGADLGVIFDTDVDRAGCVDAKGNEINRNRLIALSASIVLRENPGATIVTDSVTSDGLKTFIEQELSGVHYRFKRGYRNVINKAVELCEQGINCPLAIETSGHAALKENYFLDDGAYLVTKIIIELANGNDIEQTLKNLATPKEEFEYRFKINTNDFKDYGETVIDEFEKFCAAQDGFTIADDNREGIRVSFSDGWFLLRLSVHDPILPFNIEANSVGACKPIIKQLTEFFAQFDKLDISCLK